MKIGIITDFLDISFGGVNMYIRQIDDQVVTVLGEAPPATVRQIAYSITRR